MSPQQAVKQRSFILEGVRPLNELTDTPFNPAFPYTYCRICGELFQSPKQRKPVPLGKAYNPNTAPNDSMAKAGERRAWAFRHEATHSDKERDHYFRDGVRYFSVEAAAKLAPFGIIPVDDLILLPEVLAAINENHLKTPGKVAS